ncbi:MAG TPA: hypothetical protein PLP16_09710 [Smithellaceae bacterium]|nr:hypothetical protein [Smithellaceae bacterium]
MNISVKSKKYYFLMWEYLKKSKKYKIFCDTFAGMDPMQILASDKLMAFTKKHKVKYQVFMNYYSAFGNIHNKDFNDWWNQNVQHMTSDSYTVSNLSTDSHFLSNFMTPTLNIIYQNRNKTELSMNDLLKIRKILQCYFNADQDSIYVRINVGCKNCSNIAKIIKNLINEKNATLRLPQPIHSQRLRQTELECYLKIYDLKQKMTYKQIIEMIGKSWEKEDSKSREIWSTYARRVQNVKQIIKNIENGKFPGEYGDLKN